MRPYHLGERAKFKLISSRLDDRLVQQPFGLRQRVRATARDGEHRLGEDDPAVVLGEVPLMSAAAPPPPWAVVRATRSTAPCSAPRVPSYVRSACRYP